MGKIIVRVSSVCGALTVEGAEIYINGEFKGHKLNSFIKDTDIINDKAKEHLNSLFGDNVFSYPKSEILVRMILEFSSNPSDIVLDYHLGSGTTAAVAHKMNRQYIGVEQMDYIKTISNNAKSKLNIFIRWCREVTG